MDERHLHIVCLDVPWPVDYGGVFDLFYKIKSLCEAGIKIHLHCFEYGRGQQAELDKYCAEVFYYERLLGHKGLAWSVPYIVASRANKNLLKNLLKDDHPVLMEGMHCTWFVHNGDLPRKRCFVRLHNVEFQYYRQLAETTGSLFKKIYFARESRLLRKYEAGLKDKADFWTVTDKDLKVFTDELQYNSIDFLPLYLPPYEPVYHGEMGSYCLYHGNLGVAENEEAAMWLLQEVFADLPVPLVIAGKNPSKKLETLAQAHPHTCLVANPDEKGMQDLIQKAQVHILPSFNSTGIKLKLMNALYNGRHCLVNTAGVEGSGLDCCCEIADSREEMRAAVQILTGKPFTLYNFEHRVEQLQNLFNNKRNAEQMIRWIFGGEPTRPGKRSVSIT